MAYVQLEQWFLGHLVRPGPASVQLGSDVVSRVDQTGPCPREVKWSEDTYASHFSGRRWLNLPLGVPMCEMGLPREVLSAYASRAWSIVGVVLSKETCLAKLAKVGRV